MARDPGSVWKLLPEAGAPDGYTKTQFIVHSTGTMASAAANYSYFLRDNVVVESTFIIGWGPEDPTLQIMDSTDNADANGSANRRGISVEVVGDGVGGYNAWQRSELIRIGRWARATHGIVPRVIPSEAAGGFGWHVMFGAPGPWTSVVGKVCPGGQRVKELKSSIFPAIFAGGEEDNMANLFNTRAEFEASVKAASYSGVWGGSWTVPGTKEKKKVADMLTETLVNSRQARVDAAVARKLAEAQAEAGTALSDADVQRIAAQTAAEVAEDLSEGYDLTATPKGDPA